RSFAPTDSVSRPARAAWNEGGTNLVRIAHSGHSAFVLCLLHRIGASLSNAIVERMFKALNQPVEAAPRQGAHRLGETKGNGTRTNQGSVNFRHLFATTYWDLVPRR